VTGVQTCALPIWPEKFVYRHAPSLYPKHIIWPDFMGIGAPQSGTTWLYEQLAHHPAVHMSAVKEVHYFDRQFHKPLAWYSSFFAPGGDRVKGEVSPGYSILDRQRLDFIKACRPDLKFIYIMRNPLDQRISALRRATHSKYKGDNPFDHFTESEVVEFLTSARSPRRGNYAPDYNRAQYAHILRQWYSVFDCEQIKLFFFDQIKSEPMTLLRELAGFLNIDPAGFSDSLIRKQVNKNVQTTVPDKYYRTLVDFLEDEVRALHELLDKPPQTQAWLDSYAKWK